MIETARTWRLLRSLRAGAHSSPEALAPLQSRLVRAAVTHAYANVPLYRRLWDDAGVSPSQIRAPSDLARLPVVDGATVREALARGELPARDADPIGTFESSGTSGEALQVPRGRLEQRLWRAVALRMWLEHGYRPWHVAAHLDAQAAPSHPLRWIGVGRTAWISTDLPVDEQVAALARARADLWDGTPTVLARIAEAEVAADRLPRLIVSQGEVLDRATRELVRRALGADPVDVYGLTEVGFVAWQCERREALHVNADVVLLELLRDDGQPARPGELGAVVVTDLRGRTVPLIRYDTGDLARAVDGPCACGRTLPLVGPIEGRSRHAVSLADGRLLTTRAIVEELADVLPRTRYVLHQESPNRFRLHVEPGIADVADSAARRVSELAGQADVEVEIGLPPAPGDPAKTHPVSSSLG